MPRRAEPDPLALEIGQRVRALREAAGLTLEKLAYESDLRSKGHLSSLERGLVMPTVLTLQRIAERLGVLVADLVIIPGRSDREQLIDVSRRLPVGTLKKLTRELGASRGASRKRVRGS